MREGSCYRAVAYKRSWNYGMTCQEAATYLSVTETRKAKKENGTQQ
jgi:hypothetical protein